LAPKTLPIRHFGESLFTRKIFLVGYDLNFHNFVLALKHKMEADLFDICYADNFHALWQANYIKESELAKELDISQQNVSNLLNGKMHFTENIIGKICRHYKIEVSEFKKIKHSERLILFMQQATADTGLRFEEPKEEIKNQKIAILNLRKEIRNLTAENSWLKWEQQKTHKASEILSEKINTKIYVAI